MDVAHELTMLRVSQALTQRSSSVLLVHISALKLTRIASIRLVLL
jgi:hypothetical protein